MSKENVIVIGFTAEDGNDDSCETQSHSLQQCLQLTNNATQSISQDHKYLTSNGSKLLKYINKSKTTRLRENYVKLGVAACNTWDPNYRDITTKTANTKMMEANSYRALVSAYKVTSAIYKTNISRIQEISFLKDFKKQMVKTQYENMFYSNNKPQPRHLETTLVSQKQSTGINRISYFYLAGQMKLDENQLNNLKNLAQFIIVHCLKAACVTPATSYRGKQCVSSKFSYTTLEINRNQIIKSFFTVILQKQRKLTTVSITEIDSTEQNSTQVKKLIVENKETALKPIKRKNFRKQRIMNNRKSEKAVFSSKHNVGQFAPNEGYSRNTLHIEIERQLKPIKDQINELRQSMTSFSVINHQIRNNGIKKCISFDKIKDKMIHTSYTNTHENIHYNLQNKEIKMMSCYSQQNLEQTEIEPKKLCPLAEMYIKLSKTEINCYN